MLGARRFTRSKFHTEGLQTLGATVKKNICHRHIGHGICSSLAYKSHGIMGLIVKTGSNVNGVA
jgi:hypothetical protein